MDDIILVGSCLEQMNVFKKSLVSPLKLNDMGKLKLFLRLEFVGSPKVVIVCQRSYALKLLEDVGFLGSKLVKH